jgi:DNA-binding GntR family transcriptional regulator
MQNDADIRLVALADDFARLAEAPGPKSAKLCEALLQTIERGYWRPGDRLPPEKSLASLLSVSVGTVQSALGALAGKGVLVRRRGDGSYLADIENEGSDYWHFRFLADDGKSLLEVDTEVRAIEEVTEAGPWSDFLGIRPSYVHIRRLMRVADEFSVINDFYVEGGRFRPLLDVAPGTLDQGALRDVLHDRFNAPTFHASQTVSFTKIDVAAAQLLDVAPETLGILLEIVGYSYRDAPLSFQTVVIPPNRRKLHIPG